LVKMKATDSKKDWKVTILNVGNLE
jgi:hypothetical protein